MKIRASMGRACTPLLRAKKWRTVMFRRIANVLLVVLWLMLLAAPARAALITYTWETLSRSTAGVTLTASFTVNSSVSIVACNDGTCPNSIPPSFPPVPYPFPSALTAFEPQCRWSRHQQVALHVGGPERRVAGLDADAQCRHRQPDRRFRPLLSRLSARRKRTDRRFQMGRSGCASTKRSLHALLSLG